MDFVPADQTTAKVTPALDNNYDGPLLAFGDFMNVLGEHSGVVQEVVEGQTMVRMTASEISFDLPMELRVRGSESGEVTLQAGPPTQRVETTVFPVLHRLQVRLVRTEEVIEDTQII
jgi:hypothetical protein